MQVRKVLPGAGNMVAGAEFSRGYFKDLGCGEMRKITIILRCMKENLKKHDLR